MDISILFKTIFLVSTLAQYSTSRAEKSCKSLKCSLNSLEIRHPFQIQGLHPHHCGLPGFKLFCEHDRTMINFPDYGDLVVKSICYDTKRLDLLDPRNCVHEVFLNLNLSHTPFSYYYTLKQYKYINCTSKIASPSVESVPCLTSHLDRHYVYVVDESFVVPLYCEAVKTVAIPFSYSPYLSDDSFGLGFTWDSTGENEKIKALKAQIIRASVKSMALIFLLAGISLYAKYCKELSGKKTEDKNGEVEVDCVLQGEYEALNPPGNETNLVLKL